MTTATDRAPTATLFNHSYAFPHADKPTRIPPAVRRIAIVGGGSAGWMTAMILGNALIGKGVEIAVLESPAVGIIGVGEGSTPWLRGFFDSLGIEESEWMPECNATYKCGITFDGWSTRAGFESYFHPFASMLDNLTMTQFVHNAHARLHGADVHAHPDRFFIASHLAQRHLAPKPDRRFPFDVWYGYHFDAVLLGEYLHRKAVRRGVQYRRCHVTGVQLNERGDIASVSVEDGDPVQADIFVDCTGFAGILIQQALGTPFVSFANNLFNDAAVALPTPIGDDIPSQTISTAQKHGWRWKIPLTNRYGNGYVYSSAFCSADDAEHELREGLGMLESETPARHLKMKIGRVTKHWNRNCLAVGLAQGFIEPLEATALLFIQRTATAFVEVLEAGDLGDAAHERFNQRINDISKARAITSSRISSRIRAGIPTTGARTPTIRTCRTRCCNSTACGCPAKASPPMSGVRRSARVIRCFPGTASWRGWAFFPTPGTFAPPPRPRSATGWTKSTTCCSGAR
jgi:tryptophan 6-halogenase